LAAPAGLRWPAWALLAAVLLVALLVRLPRFLDWPAFTDETLEGLLAHAVAEGEQRPWTSVEAYIGPWHIYLEALLLRLLDRPVWLPRGLTLAFNAAAVGLTYLVARRAAGPTAALIAAALACVAPMWVLVNSHVAWAASTAPTYVMGAILATQLALAAPAGRRSGGWFFVAGLLLGLAGQAHPMTFMIAPAMALAVAWGRAGRARLRTPWPWLALPGALIGYAPLLVYNLVVTPAGSLAGGQEQLYAWRPTASPIEYATRAPELWWAHARMLAGVAEGDLLPGWPAAVVAVVAAAAAGLTLWGAVVLWRRGERLVPLTLAAMPLLLPFITEFHGGLFADRYAAPAIGLATIALGAAIAWIGHGRRWLAAALGALLIAVPALALADYYQRSGKSLNEDVIATAAILEPARECIHVVLDQRLAHLQADGGGTALRALRMTLSFADIDWETEVMHVASLRDAAREREPVQIVAVLSPQSEREFGSSRLVPLYRATAAGGLGYGVYLYRANNRAEAAPSCAPSPAPVAAPTTHGAAGG
jgi:hypothetical protein